MLKFTPMRLTAFTKKHDTEPLFNVPDMNDFTTLEEKIKSIFWWRFRKNDWDAILINPKQYAEKYIVIKYFDEKKEVIWLQKTISKGKLFVMCLQVAEENKINEFKEVVEDGKVQFRISNKQKIFEDYYVGIYFNSTKVEEENGTLFVWNIFSTQKGKYNIKESIKGLLNDIYPGFAISIWYETTKRKLQQFQEAVQKVIIRTQVKPWTISPKLVWQQSDYLVDVKLELTAKKNKQSTIDKAKDIANHFGAFQKDILSKAVDRQPFEMIQKNVRAKIWKQEVGVEFSEDEIMCVLRYQRDISEAHFNYEWFVAECVNYFSNWSAGHDGND